MLQDLIAGFSWIILMFLGCWLHRSLNFKYFSVDKCLVGKDDIYLNVFHLM